mmetsp:Transcript_13028/g.28208  ORF Transcript_13028/g.28208 Transcript_13028/m.28208 type:complete len:221 (-) Transcript_13028:231-893(-)
MNCIIHGTAFFHINHFTRVTSGCARNAHCSWIILAFTLCSPDTTLCISVTARLTYSTIFFVSPHLSHVRLALPNDGGDLSGKSGIAGIRPFLLHTKVGILLNTGGASVAAYWTNLKHILGPRFAVISLGPETALAVLVIAWLLIDYRWFFVFTADMAALSTIVKHEVGILATIPNQGTDLTILVLILAFIVIMLLISGNGIRRIGTFWISGERRGAGCVF